MTVTINKTFAQWLDYYTGHFAAISDDSLKGYWYMYGREGEDAAPPRDLAAWAAVNHEMQYRGF